MLKHYLLTTYRNLARQSAYSAINISGLAIAIASCLLIILFVKHELSYDKFHTNSKNIYRVVSDFSFNDKLDHLSVSSPPVGPTLKKDFPEVLNYTRLAPYSQKLMVRYNDRRFFEENIYFGDPSLFEMFKFPFISGDNKTALSEPNSVVISQSMADKYFGEEEPIGKILQYDNSDGTFSDYKVTGVFANLPENTHFNFSSIISYSTFVNQAPKYQENWFSAGLYTYISLSEKTSIASFRAKINGLVDKYNKEDRIKAKVKLYIEPLEDIHLYSKLMFDFQTGGNAQYISIFLIVAVFLLLIASINYTNLSTARATLRMKEIGIRKVVGANRAQLIFQLLGESAILSTISVVIALGLAELFLPVLNQLTDTNFSTDQLLKPDVLTSIFALAILVTFLSGLYPAFYLTSFEPIAIMKGRGGSLTKGLTLRKLLVVFQFAISVSLIVATAVVYFQLNYMMTKNPGFNKENIIAVRVQDTLVANYYPAIKNDLLAISSVQKVSQTVVIPGDPDDRKIMRVEGQKPEELDEVPLQPVWVDVDFLDLMQIELLQGRSFSKDMGTDGAKSFLINETCARKFGWTEPIGKRIVWGFNPQFQRDGRVIGVVRDIQTGSFKQPAEPMVFLFSNNPSKDYSLGYVLIKLKTDAFKEATEVVRKTWEKYDKTHPFEYLFLDEHMGRLYKAEANMSRLFNYFTLLTIVIACLGLLGLVSFTTEQRTKEIGIRKVLGASIASIIHLISKQFVILVIIANVIAIPVGWYFMNEWLQDFAFHIQLSPIPFLIAGVSALLIALCTVSILALRSALANPVLSLKYE